MLILLIQKVTNKSARMNVEESKIPEEIGINSDNSDITEDQKEQLMMMLKPVEEHSFERF